jgi:hypothetical protein
MSPGRPMSPLELSADESDQLKSLAGSRTSPHSIVQRAQIVLAAQPVKPTQLSPSELQSAAQPQPNGGSATSIWVSRVWMTNCVPAGPADKANRRQHPMARSLLGCCERDLQNHGSPLAADLLAHAPTAPIVQALNRSILCGEGPRHCWPLSEPTEQCDGAPRRREDADSGPGSDLPMGLGYVAIVAARC